VIDLNDLRTRPDVYKKTAKNKGIDLDIDAFLDLDQKRKDLLPSVEEARATQNDASKKIPTLKGAEKEKKLAEMKTLSDNLKKSEADLRKIEEQWKDIQLQLPSIPLDKVPIGKDEDGNKEVEKWGDPSTPLGMTPPKEPQDHIALGEFLDILDIPRAAKVAGSRSYFLKGEGARLSQALMRYTMDHLHAKGWTLMIPPQLATYDCFMGTGFFPGVEQTNIYAVGGHANKDDPIESDDLYLIGTSEVTVCSYHKDEILSEDALPKRYMGYSTCFRREAGTYGKDTKGIYRVHQFEKVEQVVLCRADQDEALALHDEIRLNAEEVLQALKLPYRIVDVCTGDMGKGKVYMQDIETWMPSRNSYGETHSCSYLGDFQARRLNIRYKDGEDKKQFVHTLNNTCIANTRVLIAILETYQNKDGSVTIPDVLRPYMGGKDLIIPNVS
jgi:seryl-tRNA synthetase